MTFLGIPRGSYVWYEPPTMWETECSDGPIYQRETPDRAGLVHPAELVLEDMPERPYRFAIRGRRTH